MKPCVNCLHGSWKGMVCDIKISETCIELQDWYRWRLHHERHADPQETRPVEHESECLTAAERNE